jgi:hypothetical protein
MVDIPDTGVMVAIVGAVLTFMYFIVTRKDRGKFDKQTNTRSDQEAERDKEELARKVKKELIDEAEKVERIRKDVAVTVKEETKIDTDQKLKEQKSDYDHKLEMYEERSKSRFVATDKVMEGLMSKIVDTAEINANALIKINESIESMRKLFYEISGKVNRVEREQDKQSDN